MLSLAHVNGLKVTMRGGFTVRGEKAAGGLIAHRAAEGSRAFALTTPKGAALGDDYTSLKAAKAAAECMAPYIKDVEGLDLETVFGDVQTAAKAFAQARSFTWRAVR